MAFGLSDRVKNIAPSPTLSIDTKTKAMIADGLDVINLSVGEPDFGTPDIACAAGKVAIDQQFTKYTAVPGIVELRKKIADQLATKGLRYTADDILVSSGAKHSLYNAFMALCNPGDEVILPAPYWVSYPEMVRLAEAVPVMIPTDESTNFKITPAQLEAAITPKTKVLLLNSPSNPTGSVYTPAELQALADVVRKHEFYVISDEIYDQLVYGVEQISIASLGEDIQRRTIVINGFSKSYSMTGWRVGYLAADRAIVKAMTSFQSHTTANPASISQKAAVAALDHRDEAMVPEFIWRRDYVLNRLSQMPYITCATPTGAFYVFPNCSATFGKTYQNHPVQNCDDFASLLLEHANISLVPGSGFGAPNNFRISYATSRENLAKAMDRLEAFLNELV
ncbi:pyridoxal phosphate-dependent aminotransferase [Tumebacillus permanentifrigoris]|uniref:Aminotransferase n=1 Tax=Tumebacillus permanentifrigoris TaxID=378543 RepID=A0A316DF77_9BACL|nr:pyridoxal phosphate-dependent aminotransferase [Tumebacillus permanentifrigoris]PWK16376.1 aspartate aminotransferase [Tumebacillus permanentifrigoris]